MSNTLFLVSGADRSCHQETIDRLEQAGREVTFVPANQWKSWQVNFEADDSYIIDQQRIKDFEEATKLVQFLLGIGHGHTHIVLLIERARLGALVMLEQRGVCVHPDDESMDAALAYLLGKASEHHDPAHSKLVTEALRATR